MQRWTKVARRDTPQQHAESPGQHKSMWCQELWWDPRIYDSLAAQKPMVNLLDPSGYLQRSIWWKPWLIKITSQNAQRRTVDGSARVSVIASLAPSSPPIYIYIFFFWSIKWLYLMSEDSKQKSLEVKPRVKDSLSESPNNKQSKVSSAILCQGVEGLLMGTTIGEIILTRQRSQAPGLSVNFQPIQKHPETSSNRRNQIINLLLRKQSLSIFPLIMLHVAQITAAICYRLLFLVRVDFTPCKNPSSPLAEGPLETWEAHHRPCHCEECMRWFFPKNATSTCQEIIGKKRITSLVTMPSTWV